MKRDADKIDERLEYELSGIYYKLSDINYNLREIKKLYEKELLHKGVIKDDKQSNTSR
jgi:hypothetical protein